MMAAARICARSCDECPDRCARTLNHPSGDHVCDQHAPSVARPVPTRQECIDAAGEAFAYGRRVMYGAEGHTVEEAARLAHTPGGPSIPELEASIRARRIAAGATFAPDLPLTGT